MTIAQRYVLRIKVLTWDELYIDHSQMVWTKN